MSRIMDSIGLLKLVGAMEIAPGLVIALVLMSVTGAVLRLIMFALFYTNWKEPKKETRIGGHLALAFPVSSKMEV